MSFKNLQPVTFYFRTAKEAELFAAEAALVGVNDAEADPEAMVKAIRKFEALRIGEVK